MKRKRKHIPLAEQLAAALSMLLPQALRDEMRRERATAKDVRALFQMDHVVLHAHGGSDKWHNLTPMVRALHREKSKGDTSIAAKSKRIAKKEAMHRARMTETERGLNRVMRMVAAATRKIESRGFDKKHRPMRAR